MNPLRPWLSDIPQRALVDTDPVFTQLRHLSDDGARAEAARHTAFFTYGENFGKPTCEMPDDGFPWRPTRQPVVVDAWPVTPGSKIGCFTTVMQWESYAPRVHDGRTYGMNAASFHAFEGLPKRTNARLELALGGETAPRVELMRRGWKIRDPAQVSADPWTYQRYLMRSKGEFSVAKHGYVAARSGWFSERSAGYLACGRPVVVQDTGFTDWLPSGRGVIGVETVDDALGALAEVESDYEGHCSAARAVVEEHFDARKVLASLLEELAGSSVGGDARG